MSVVIHEVSHGFVADRCGDKTARMAGRLTLNPVKHLDPFGSVILPAILYFTTGFVFGWARPVPYNPDNLRDRKWGTIAVASAGILANLCLAIIFGILIRVAGNFISSPEMLSSFLHIASQIVLVNTALAIFNLVPIPPLDGSKILFQILPSGFHGVIDLMEQYSIIFLVVFIFFFSNALFPLLSGLYTLFTGLPL